MDIHYLKTLGLFDIVYAWGMLHHTGEMWKALENVSFLVTSRGKLFISIYTHQGGASHRWKGVKQIHNGLPKWARFLVVWPTFVRVWGPISLNDLSQGKPISGWLTYSRDRGMSPWRGVIDWVGGYPFEVARAEEIFDFYKAKGFNLLKLKTCGSGHGCNEFVFERVNIETP